MSCSLPCIAASNERSEEEFQLPENPRLFKLSDGTEKVNCIHWIRMAAPL